MGRGWRAQALGAAALDQPADHPVFLLCLCIMADGPGEVPVACELLSMAREAATEVVCFGLGNLRVVEGRRRKARRGAALAAARSAGGRRCKRSKPPLLLRWCASRSCGCVRVNTQWGSCESAAPARPDPAPRFVCKQPAPRSPSVCQCAAMCAQRRGDRVASLWGTWGRSFVRLRRRAPGGRWRARPLRVRVAALQTAIHYPRP